jgi:hypothetical protein
MLVLDGAEKECACVSGRCGLLFIRCGHLLRNSPQCVQGVWFLWGLFVNEKSQAVQLLYKKGLPYVHECTRRHRKTGTLKNSKRVKHFYGDSTLLTVPLIYDY